MTENFSKQELVLALKNIIIGKKQAIKDTQYLNNASKVVGFSGKMIDIANDATLSIEIKQKALIQLKNIIKLRWNHRREQINVTQKESIKNALLPAIIRCSKIHKFMKIYKQVLKIIIAIQYKTWLPVILIIQRIKEEKDVAHHIHILLAIAASFQFSITEDERIYFYQIIKLVLPVLLELITKHQESELIYLSIKFLWKAVHYEISLQTKNLTQAWMPILHMIIGATNQVYDKNPQQLQIKYSPEFYYFHSKKWATRIFLRFIQKHAKPSNFNKQNDNKIYAENWYNNFGNNLITALINQFSHNTVQKVRYFQLKCVQSLINERPEAVKQYADIFQYNILLRYIKLKPEDQQLAQRNPLQFIKKEDEPVINFNNLKRVATDIWIGFAQLGSKKQNKSQVYEPGIFFYQNMNFLENKLQGSNPIERQFAIYLLCQLRSPIIRCKHVISIMPTLLSRYIIPEFQNSIMFLRARALDIFSEYGSLELDPDTIKKAVGGIYMCLTNKQYPLVTIKAASAFKCILKHKTAQQFVQPLLKNVLTIYLQLIQQYDLQNIVNNLESIVEIFSIQISPFAYDLIKHLSKIFFQLFHNNQEKRNEQSYNGQAQLAAAGCLKTITKIIKSSIPQQIMINLESQVIKLLQFIFGQKGTDFVQDSLIMLNAYLFNTQKLSDHLWFFFQAVIYNLVGVPKHMQAVIQKNRFSENHIKILNNWRHNDNWQILQYTLPVLRNYIQKSSQMIAEYQNYTNIVSMKENIESLLFYLLSQVYKKGPNDYTGQLDIIYSTALLIYLLQNYQKSLSQAAYNHIWQFCRVNIVKFRSTTLKKLNSQLIGLLFWVFPIQILTIAHKQQMISPLMKQIISYQPKYTMPHQRKRVILGLSTLLSLPQKPVQIMQKIPQIFKVTLKLLRKNIDHRLGQQRQQNSNDNLEDEDKGQQNFDHASFNDEEDQNFWDEQYDNNYNSRLNSVNEIAQFKKIMRDLSIEQNSFYSSLVQTVTKEQLTQIDAKINKLLEKQEKKY